MSRPRKVKKVTKVVDIVEVPEKVEIEQVNDPIASVEAEPVTEEQLAELNEGLEVPSQPETIFIAAISTEVKVAKKEIIILNDKKYVQVTTPEGVTYLV